MKKYFENPMLQVVSINKKDIIATSELGKRGETGTILAPELRGVFDPSDDWANAGY